MKASEICKDFEEDSIWINSKSRTICAYWNLDDPGLCRHEKHNVCHVKLMKSGITDPWLLNFMEEMGCVLVKEDF